MSEIVNTPVQDPRVEYVEAFRTFYSNPAREFDRHELKYVERSPLARPRSERPKVYDARLTNPEAYINHPYPWMEDPDYSIIVPVALMTEPHGNVLDTIRLLKKQSENGAGTGEILLWCNTQVEWELKEHHITQPYLAPALGSVRSIVGEYNELLDFVKRTCSDISGDTIRIRAAVNLLRPGEGLNEIRARSTEAVAKDAFRRGIPITLPVGWIDADTRHMQKHAIRDRIDVLKSGQAHFVQGELVFIGNGDHDLSHLHHVKISLVHSIARRMLERNLGPNEARKYVNECGLFFTLKSYLYAGGVSTLDPDTGESRSLMERAEHVRDLLEPTPELVHHLKHATVFTSDRRWRRLAASLPADILPDLEDGSDYVVHQKIEDGRLPRRTEAPTVEEVLNMIDKQENNQKGLTKSPENNHEGIGLRPDQRRSLYGLIGRQGFAMAAKDTLNPDTIREYVTYTEDT